MEDNKLRKGGIGKILYRVFNSIFYFLPILLSNIRFRRILLLPLYAKKQRDIGQQAKKNQETPKEIFYMVLPETTFSGGLSDRLRGIVAIYAECKRQRLPFRIVFEPLHLEDYLEPNAYDWRIRKDEVCWDIKNTFPCVLLTYHSNSRNRYQHWVQNSILRRYIHKPFKQIHIYSNMICRDEEYRTLFNELFKPTKELQKQIDYHMKSLGGKRYYISCTFRFRQLLGDFQEGGETLQEVEREPYIKRCIDTVKALHEQYFEKNILVTADSSTFLSKLKELRLPYVYIMPGKVVHVGFTFDANHATYLKSFLDMYMISYAETVYLVRDSLMYHSGFPFRAALLGGANYKEIDLQ